jgi:hypothetical protein
MEESPSPPLPPSPLTGPSLPVAVSIPLSVAPSLLVAASPCSVASPLSAAWLAESTLPPSTDDASGPPPLAGESTEESGPPPIGLDGESSALQPNAAIVQRRHIDQGVSLDDLRIRVCDRMKLLNRDPCTGPVVVIALPGLGACSRVQRATHPGVTPRSRQGQRAAHGWRCSSFFERERQILPGAAMVTSVPYRIVARVADLFIHAR